MSLELVKDEATGAAARTMIACTDPATGEVLGEVPVFGPDEVRAVVAAAHAAQEAWGRTTHATRRRVLAHVLDHVVDHADEIADAISRDAGKTRENAMVELWPVCEKLRHLSRHAERWLRPETVSSGILVHKKARIEYPPLGVVGVIAPWNYPFQNILGPALPALMAGNGVVVKVSEWTSWSAAPFERIVQEALASVGQSPDLFRVITGYGETGAALVGSGVELVIFTGSVGNGRRVAAEAAQTLTPVILELGGKDALVVCDDADLEQAVHSALGGVLISAGQNCIAAERLLVQEPIYEAFERRLVELVGQLRQGPSTNPDGTTHLVDVGAMTMPGQLDLVERLVDDAVAKGARALVGGKRAAIEGGLFFEPTVLAGVTDAMDIFHEETFGPVFCLVKIADDEEAVRVANQVRFGLSSAVFSKDRDRAERLGERLVAGSTNINDFGLHYMAQDLPFGGVKDSGYGRLNGKEGLRACTNRKAVLTDRFRGLHVPNVLFPVKPGDRAKLRGIIATLYGRGWSRKLRGLRDLLRSALGRPS